MASTSWKGQLRLGLLTIPIRLQNMVRSSHPEKISFRQLNPRTGNPISTVRIDSETGDQVHAIQKGVEIGDQVIALDSTQVTELEQMFGSVIEVEGFISLKKVANIDPVWIDRHYAIKVEDVAKHSWTVLCKALAKSGKAAFARTGISNREVPLLLLPANGSIRALVMHWPSSIYDDAMSTLPAEDLNVDNLVDHLVTYIDANAKDEFDISKISGKQLAKLQSMLDEIMASDSDKVEETEEEAIDADGLSALLKTMSGA